MLIFNTKKAILLNNKERLNKCHIIRTTEHLLYNYYIQSCKNYQEFFIVVTFLIVKQKWQKKGVVRMANKIRTSKGVAKKASSQLRSKKTTKATKSVVSNRRKQFKSPGVTSRTFQVQFRYKNIKKPR